MILVDAWNTFVTKDGVNEEMREMLDAFPHTKIIVTNANDEEKVQFGIVNMPFEVFSLSHNPNKTDPVYFANLLQHFHLKPSEVIYFEHNPDAVKSAQSLGITTFHYNAATKDVVAVRLFLEQHL